MNICILSMQQINNMGSLLQAYSLKKMIEELGHTVSFIDIESIPEDNNLLEGFFKEYSEEKEGDKTLFSKFNKIDRYAINRLRIKKKAEEQNSIFESFRKEQLGIEVQSGNEYDVCVIGSDEVFNCLTPSEWGFTSQLFGNVPQAKKIITYAASCGSTKYEYLPETVKSKIKDTFNDVSAFSVRDDIQKSL